jgi:hypothetical protein
MLCGVKKRAEGAAHSSPPKRGDTNELVKGHGGNR